VDDRASDTHSGSTFDDFLEEAGYRAEAERVAIERVHPWRLERKMAQADGPL
jgi:hypothetical protein